MKKQNLSWLFPLMAGFLFIALISSCASKPEPVPVTDIDGNIYKTVIIRNPKGSTREWFAENLKTTRYNDGAVIPHVKDDRRWANLSIGAYCWYGNDVSSGEIYGALYNWYAVNTGKLCPEGWRVPKDEDWIELIDYLGGEEIAGGKLKATGSWATGNGLWDYPNVRATNEIGFSALPGEIRNTDGSFGYLEGRGLWWSSTEYSSSFAYGMGLFSNHGRASIFHGDKTLGFSLRCVRSLYSIKPVKRYQAPSSRRYW